MIISGIEMGLPFVRMLALTRILPLAEVGFVSLLTAFNAFLEVSTDLAIYRFVYSTPKEQFEEALASAHALSVVRGFVVCVLALCAAPLVATAVSLGDYWMSFAAIAPVILIRSFEHLSPRVAERDFLYWPQLKTTGIADILSVASLIVAALLTRSHVVVFVSLYVQVIVLFFASRLVSPLPYRLDFRSPLFKSAFKFGYPLMFNGFGLAIAMQADRFVVAALYNLDIVAVYSVVILAVTMPMGLFIRVLGTTMLARFYHARSVRSRLDQEVRTASSLVAVVAAFYAGGVILLMNFAVAFVFGQKFYTGYQAMMLLGTAAFIRLVRVEPFTSVMLNASRTKRLAASNVLVASFLAYMALFSFFDRSIIAVLAARLLGELTAVAVTFAMARRAPEGGRFVFSFSTLIGFVFVGFACLESLALEWQGDSWPLTLAACAVYAIAVSLWAAVDLRHRVSRLRRAIEPGSKLETDALPS
jgi:O-antigen/teichoic acid export membrane protein